MYVACIYHYGPIQSSFTALNVSCAPPVHPSHCLLILFNLGQPSMSTVLPLPGCHMAGTTGHVGFAAWLLSFSNMLLFPWCLFLGFIAHFFLALSNIPLSICTTLYLFIQLVKGHLDASVSFGIYE